MKQAAMKTALRVLTAYTEKRQPDPEDVAALRHYAPHLANLPMDELACELIKTGITDLNLAIPTDTAAPG
jgi:hypothetical protein